MHKLPFKECKKHGVLEDKDKKFFTTIIRGVSYSYYRCRICCSMYDKKRRSSEQYRHSISLYYRKYYQSNIEKFRERSRKYYKNNREEFFARNKKNIENNREKYAAYRKNYWKNSCEKLTDCYIKNIIKNKHRLIKTEDITQEFIECYREFIKLKRYLKEVNNGNSRQ